MLRCTSAHSRMLYLPIEESRDDAVMRDFVCQTLSLCGAKWDCIKREESARLSRGPTNGTTPLLYIGISHLDYSPYFNYSRLWNIRHFCMQVPNIIFEISARYRFDADDGEWCL